MWEISNTSQILFLLRSVVLGCVFSFIYDILRAIRLQHRFSLLAVALQDFLFLCFLAPVTFLFLIAATNGQLRLYIFFGLTVGFFLFRLTLSRLILPVFSFVFRVIFTTFGRVKSAFNRFFAFCGKNIADYYKKALNYFKKGLKKP